MRLRKPCEHGQYDDHRWWDADGSVFTCPGGEFLADDALRFWVTRTDGEAMGEYGGFMFETLDDAKAMVREELEIEQDLIGDYYEAGHQLPSYTIEVSVIVDRIEADALTVREGAG